MDAITKERLEFEVKNGGGVFCKECCVCDKTIYMHNKMIYEPGIGIRGSWFHEKCYDREIAGI